MAIGTQTGVAHVYGAAGDLTWTGIATNADQQVTEVGLTDEAAVEEFDEGYGETVSLDITKKRRRCSIDFVPTAASGANTAANAITAMKLPPIPAKVTLSNFQDTDSQLNGDWIYSGGATVRQSKGVAVYTLPLWQPKSGSATVTTLTTAVS